MCVKAWHNATRASDPGCGSFAVGCRGDSEGDTIDRQDFSVTVTPDVVTPRQTVSARVAAALPVDDASAAWLEWGYTNFYRYHCADGPESVTAPGEDRGADAWICVTRTELPLTAGKFDSATATFRVPPWAPASSAQIARWSCRLVVSCDGRDVDRHAEFTVHTGPDQFADEAAMQEPVTVLAGDAETAVDITLPTPVCAAGAVIRGDLTLTPTADLPDGDVVVRWQQQCESHPMQRTPAAVSVLDGPIIKVGSRIPLRTGAVVQLPFEIPVPGDAAPTATAVNSSMTWFIQADMSYAGAGGHRSEQVLKPIFVVSSTE
jgi:hypothetical protein